MTEKAANVRQRKSNNQRIYREKERQSEETRLEILRSTKEFYRLISKAGR